MSKMDGVSPRKPADLEYKYNFGKSFAEVYNLIADVQKGTESAIKDLDKKLDPEEIFNRLTNYGEVQGIYRGEDGDVYVNATYIKSGKLAAEYIDADNLKVKAANITGTLTANQIDATDLTASKLSGDQINLTSATGDIFGKLSVTNTKMLYILSGVASGFLLGGTDANPVVTCLGTFYAENVIADNIQAYLDAFETRISRLERLFG